MDIKNISDLLRNSIGSSKIKTSEEFLLSYSYDATGIKKNPDIVAFPENESDISNILKIASKFKIPVTPRGGGVGYSGGSVPVQGGIVMAFSKMNRILKFDEKNLLIEAEPGVITGRIIDICESRGLFYPPDPASLKNSTIGGNVSENAGGPRCFKYGVTSDYVMAVEGFLMNGEKVKFGSYSIKDVSGYDIKKLIVGSEGTLIVISKIVLKVIPKPESRILIRVEFNSLKAGADFIMKIIRFNLSPSVLEFIDKTSLDAVNKYLRTENERDTKSIVILELDGSSGDVNNKLKSLKRLALESGVNDIKIADNTAEMEELWSIRRNLSPAISNLKPKKINEDIAVPIGKVSDTIEYISGLADEYDMCIVMFGHLGDGNIHTNIMIDPADKRELENSKIILDKIFKYVVSVKGTISGEHGIGLSKKEYLGYQYSKTEIDIFRKIKSVFDPDNLLNPGKIF
ncbi:MAG: FAD-binding protein [Candidatus Aminicenantes bacterium]|nr:FAD-binding protein [Candidatus Aminicenantes bacterium]